MYKIFKIAIVSTFLLAVHSQSVALPKTGDTDSINQLKSQGAGLTSKITFKKLKRVHTFMSNNKSKKAIILLKKLLVTTKARKFEHAQVLQIMGMIYAQQGQYDKATQALKSALALKALPYSLSLSTMYSLAQLSMGQGRPEIAEQQINKWFLSISKPKPSAYVLYAYIMVEQKKSSEALESIEFALKNSSKKSSSWLQLAAALNLENKKYGRAVIHLKELLNKDVSSKKYWKQLVAAYLNLNDYKNALATMELASKMGLIEEKSEILNLTSLLLQQGLPYWGARLLENAIDKKIVKADEKIYLTLAQCWMMAEEIDKAIAPMSLAVKLSKTGKTAARLGQLYMEKEQWRDAQRYLKIALKKGSLSSPGRAHLALGIIHFSLLQKGEAERYFKMSLKNGKTKSSAQQWLNHMKESAS